MRARAAVVKATVAAARAMVVVVTWNLAPAPASLARHVEPPACVPRRSLRSRITGVRHKPAGQIRREVAGLHGGGGARLILTFVLSTHLIDRHRTMVRRGAPRRRAPSSRLRTLWSFCLSTSARCVSGSTHCLASNSNCSALTPRREYRQRSGCFSANDCGGLNAYQTNSFRPKCSGFDSASSTSATLSGSSATASIGSIRCSSTLGRHLALGRTTRARAR